MKTTVFAKKRVNSEGKVFYNYLGKLRKKDGTELNVTVKFREDCGQPDWKECPMNIEFDKEFGNLVTTTYTHKETGELRERYTLWISEWHKGEEYVDHSLDDFE
jgi:hypothetical protein